MSEQATPASNCPFYGRHTSITLLGHGTSPVQSLHFIPSPGSQCALRIHAFTVCDLALEGKPVNWAVCPVWAGATRGPLEKL